MTPYYTSPGGDIYQGDAKQVLSCLPDKSVHCCVTSPPYWGLRDYGVPGQLGLEKTPEEFIEKLVDIFREVRRVLRDDGNCWINLGDSYAASRSYQVVDNKHIDVGNKIGHTVPPGLKQKDLCGIPWRVALALQADGWYLRSAIPWVKRSAMPESVTDRPASALEHVFLLTKSPKYYFDMEAIKKNSLHEHSPKTRNSRPGIDVCGGNQGSGKPIPNPAGNRNFRNTDLFYQSIEPPHGMIFCGDEMVGIDVNPKGFKEAHFATFPPALIEPCILAGTSEKGCCAECGAPLKRVVDKIISTSKPCPKEQAAHEARGGTGNHAGTVGKSGGGRINGYSKTTGWKPTCNCKLYKLKAGVPQWVVDKVQLL